MVDAFLVENSILKMRLEERISIHIPEEMDFLQSYKVFLAARFGRVLVGDTRRRNV